MKPSRIIGALAGALVLLSAVSCQGSKEDTAVQGLNERIANAAKYRLVNLTSSTLSGTSNAQEFLTLEPAGATPMLKISSGRNLVVEAKSATAKSLKMDEKLPAKAQRSFYVVVEGGALKSITIDNDPMEPNNGPVIRAVNLSGDNLSFKANVDGKEVDLGSPAPGTGGSTSPSIPTGKLVASATMGSTTLKTVEFNATVDNSFSVVAYKDANGKTQIALVVNHVKSTPVAGGASPAG